MLFPCNSPVHHGRDGVVAAWPVLLRMAQPELDGLLDAVLQDRAPLEGGAFALFGFRNTARSLVVTLARLLPPQADEIASDKDRIRINHPYLRRAAEAARHTGLAVGFVHSHPAGAPPRPSGLDDEMDAYLSDYLRSFTPNQPFISLILSHIESDIAVGGRVLVDDEWALVERVAAERMPHIVAWPKGQRPPPAPPPPESVARMTSAFGLEAYQRLARSTVALIGAGGTGSAAIPILARAGVGRLIVIDGDHVTVSNLERLHGSVPSDVDAATPKAVVAKRAVAAFAPHCEVQAIIGRLPQKEIVDLVIQADLLMGCTDQHSSRMAVAEIASRYLVPAIDCGGLIEGADGVVTGQLVQIVRFLAADPCPVCRGMISPLRVEQELLPAESRLDPARQVEIAKAAGVRHDPILSAIPQIDTVGYITTTAGTLAAGFAIGWLTGRFEPRFERLQLDLVSPWLGAVDRPQSAKPDCACVRLRGYGDQCEWSPCIRVPAHWPAVQFA
jgi:molybdopterin-synthase adenylyltransferase